MLFILHRGNSICNRFLKKKNRNHSEPNRTEPNVMMPSEKQASSIVSWYPIDPIHPQEFAASAKELRTGKRGRSRRVAPQGGDSRLPPTLGGLVLPRSWYRPSLALFAERKQHHHSTKSGNIGAAEEHVLAIHPINLL